MSLGLSARRVWVRVYDRLNTSLWLTLMAGIVLDDEAQNIIGQGRALKDKESKPRKEDIVQE